MAAEAALSAGEEAPWVVVDAAAVVTHTAFLAVRGGEVAVAVAFAAVLVAFVVADCVQR